MPRVKVILRHSFGGTERNQRNFGCAASSWSGSGMCPATRGAECRGTSRSCNGLGMYEGVPTSFRTGRLERELQMVPPSATRCSCIAILWVSVVSFATITLCVPSQRVFIIIVVVYFFHWFSPETFGYTSYGRNTWLKSESDYRRWWLRFFVGFLSTSGWIPSNRP
jgi:hypothetical protein